MTKIQETLNSLQPYLIGIRYLEGTALVDVVLKENWSIVDSVGIKAVKGDDAMNYYMFFSESENIGLDDLLAHVRKIINFNIDREKKQALLNTKIVELKNLFKQYDLTRLNKLKFSFDEDESVSLYDDEIIDEPEIKEEKIEPLTEPVSKPIQFLDENKQPIELTEEELEILEEEARAERNIMMTKNKSKKTFKGAISNIELPPKMSHEQRLKTSEPVTTTGCHCGPDEACNKCIDSKGY